MMPLHDEPCMWPQVACTCDPYAEVPKEGDIPQNGRIVGKRVMTHVEWLIQTYRPSAWWSCRCSACVLQRQEKDDQYRDNAANGQL